MTLGSCKPSKTVVFWWCLLVCLFSPGSSRWHSCGVHEGQSLLLMKVISASEIKHIWNIRHS